MRIGCFPLTPARSLGERENRARRFRQSRAPRLVATRGAVFALAAERSGGARESGGRFQTMFSRLSTLPGPLPARSSRGEGADEAPPPPLPLSPVRRLAARRLPGPDFSPYHFKFHFSVAYLAWASWPMAAAGITCSGSLAFQTFWSAALMELAGQPSRVRNSVCDRFSR